MNHASEAAALCHFTDMPTVIVTGISGEGRSTVTE